MIKRLARSAMALLLTVSLLPANVAAQVQDRAGKIYEELSKLDPDSEIEVRLVNGTRLRGHVIRFDRMELVLAEQQTPILLAGIQSIKRVRQWPAWNPATGFIRSWKGVALLGGILLIGIIAAKNTP